eukprot:gene21017-27235_t
MSNFTSGANAFLNSEYRIKSFGPNPSTQRGSGTVINIHPKERKLIYPSGKFIIVRNLDDPTDSFVYRGHSTQTTVAKFSPNGYWVCSADISGKIRVWSWDNPEHLTKLETSVFSGSVSDLDWDFESKKIVVVGEGSGMLAKCITWDTGNSVGEMVGHNKRILSVAYKPTRPFKIITGSEDMRTIFYSGPPFKLDHSNSTHSNFVNSVRYSSDGSKIISVGSDKKIQLYDGVKGEPTASIPNAHEGTIFAGSFNSDGTKFATASADKTIKIWDTISLESTKQFLLSTDPQIGDMQVSLLWVGTEIVSVSLNGDINIFNIESGAISRIIQSHQVSITSLYYHRDTSTVFTGSFDGVVIATNLITGISKKVLGVDKKNIPGGAHSGKIVGIALSSTGDIISVGWDDTIRFASLSTLSYYSDISLGSQPTALASSNEITVIATNNELQVYRGTERVSILTSLGFTVSSIAVLTDSEVAVGGEDSKIHIYTINNNSLIVKTVIDNRSAVTALSYAPDGSVLAVGDAGRIIEVFDRESYTPKIKGKWVFHTSKITALSWSPNGLYLASGSLDENIFLWNYNNPMTKIQIPYAHTGGVTGLDWIDNSNLVSSGNDHSIITWKIPELAA